MVPDLALVSRCPEWREVKQNLWQSIAPSGHGPKGQDSLALGEPRVHPIGANLLCYDIFEPEFCDAWKIPKVRAPAVANRRAPLPDSIQAPQRVEPDGE